MERPPSKKDLAIQHDQDGTVSVDEEVRELQEQEEIPFEVAMQFNIHAEPPKGPEEGK